MSWISLLQSDSSPTPPVSHTVLFGMRSPCSSEPGTGKSASASVRAEHLHKLLGILQGNLFLLPTSYPFPFLISVQTPGCLFYALDQNPELFVLLLKLFQSWPLGALQVDPMSGTCLWLADPF